MATITLDTAIDWSTPASSDIETAITEAGVNGTVLFPAGEYRITEPIVPLAGQTLAGEGYESTILRIDFAAIDNFANMSLIRKNESSGVTLNPGVTVVGFTIDGGRDQCGRPNYETGPDCPYGAGGGVSLGIGWTLSRCRLTNLNGAKTGCFGAHGARIEYCVWDNDDGGTGGDQDNIGGGGVTNLWLVGNTFAENCAGSGIDITTGADIHLINNKIGYRSLILEGIQGAEVRANLIYRSAVDSDAGGINIKSNTAYASAEQAGAWCSTDVVVEGNTIINSYNPGIVVSSTWDDKGPGDTYDAGRYGQSKGIVVRDNTVVSPYGLGIYAGGQDRARADSHVAIYQNIIVDPREATAGLGNEWNSGAGYFACAGVGVGSGNQLLVANNRVLRTSTDSAQAIAVVDGARGGSSKVTSTRAYQNSVSTVADTAAPT